MLQIMRVWGLIYLQGSQLFSCQLLDLNNLLFVHLKVCFRTYMQSLEQICKHSLLIMEEKEGGVIKLLEVQLVGL